MPAPDPQPIPRIAGLRRALRASGLPSETPSPLRSGVHTRGYLPHVKREGASYFITFRLADSLPQEVLLAFKSTRSEHPGEKTHTSSADQADVGREYRRQVERYLDRGVGACYLRRPEVADMTAEALLHFHGTQYLLDEWVVMPNHVHLVLWPMPGHTVSEILRSRKRHTARHANTLLDRTGEAFWQHESYDRWIRNEDEKARICRYIRNNPVTAGLCQRPEDWRWSSAHSSQIPSKVRDAR